jgi:c-di-GMP-binding flagellar brake protein YcgR
LVWFMKKNKRSVERLSLEIQSRIKVQTGEGALETLDLFTANISSGGAYFKTTDPLAVGTEVAVKMILEVPSGKNGLIPKFSTIDISGKVVRSEKDGMAIQFKNDYKIQSVGVKRSHKRPESAPVAYR